jgi:hypothetical protein
MEFPVWTIQHQSRLRGTLSPAHAASGAQGHRGEAVPCAAEADGGMRNGRAGGDGGRTLATLCWRAVSAACSKGSMTEHSRVSRICIHWAKSQRHEQSNYRIFRRKIMSPSAALYGEDWPKKEGRVWNASSRKAAIQKRTGSLHRWRKL